MKLAKWLKSWWDSLLRYLEKGTSSERGISEDEQLERLNSEAW
jgi:hypothetical protein